MPERLKNKAVPLSEVFLKGTLVHNPVLVELIGICPVAAAAVSLRAGALLAAVSSLILIVTQVAASAFLKKIVRWVRVAVYLLLGLAVVTPVIWLLEKYNIDVRITVGIYLPLLAVNSLAALRCEKIAVRSSVKHSFLDAIAASIGYSAVLLAAGFIRELFGNGTILEKPVAFFPAASGLLMPFGGFLVLGFLAAALKAFVMRFYPKYAKAMSVEISTTGVTMKLKPETDAAADDEFDAGEETPVEPSAAQVVAQTGDPEPGTTTEPAEDEPFDLADNEVLEALDAAEESPVSAAEESLPVRQEDLEPVPPEQHEEQIDEMPEELPEAPVPAQTPGLPADLDEPAVPEAEDVSELPAPQNQKEKQANNQESDIFDVKLKELFRYLDELENKDKTESKE